MKIEKLLLGLFASFLMVGCSQNDDAPNASEEAKGKDSYMSIKISSDLASRANTGDFVDGTGAESEVSSIHFFFFKQDGTPFTLQVPDDTDLAHIDKTRSRQNYIYVDNTGNRLAIESENANHIEKILNAFVVFKVVDSNYPSSIIAVLNWDYQADAALSKDDLMTNLIAENEAITSTDFIMTNSVYKSDDYTTIFDAKTVNETNFGTSVTDANLQAVELHVERLAARVTTTVDGTQVPTGEYSEEVSNGKTIPTFKVAETPDLNNDGVLDEVIYAQLLGWDLNTTITHSYLVKKLNDSWTDANTPFAGWNDYSTKRSNYSVSVPEGTYGTTKVSHNKSFVWSELANSKNTFGGTDYCLENTSEIIEEGNKQQTNVLVAAQLVKKESNGNNTPVTVCRWGTFYYVGLDALADAVAANIANYVDIQGENLNIVPVYDYSNDSNPDNTSKTTYQVRFTIASNASDTYPTPGGGSITKADVDAILAQKGTANVWMDGKTYYFTPIKHIVETTQKDAVIRNNAYNVVITGVSGLGTPVYTPPIVPGVTPDEPIIPDPILPGESETFISAKINVLSWRVVNNSVVLGQ